MFTDTISTVSSTRASTRWPYTACRAYSGNTSTTICAAERRRHPIVWVFPQQRLPATRTPLCRRFDGRTRITVVTIRAPEEARLWSVTEMDHRRPPKASFSVTKGEEGPPVLRLLSETHFFRYKDMAFVVGETPRNHAIFLPPHDFNSKSWEKFDWDSLFVTDEWDVASADSIKSIMLLTT